MAKSKSSRADKTRQKANGGTPSAIQKEFFLYTLKNVYGAEKHLTKTCSKIPVTTAPELQSALEGHIVRTKEHLSRLEKAFEILGVKALPEKNGPMEQLLKEGEMVIEKTDVGSLTRELAIITIARKVAHFKIVAYKTLLHLAMNLGQAEIASILNHTLEEEVQTDTNLAEIAENKISQGSVRKTG